MNYYLHRQGQEPILVPLEELRRQRAAGELTGAELVWAEGLPEWQPLDTILASQHRPTAAPPPLDPNAIAQHPAYSRSQRQTILLGACVIGLGVAGVFAWWGARILKPERDPARTVVRKAKPAHVPVTEVFAPLPTNSTTYREVRIRERQFRVRQWVDGYKERGQRNHPLDADALRAVEGWMARHYGEPGQTNPPVTELFDKLVAAPDFSDPLVLTLSADETTRDQVVPRLERALAAYAGSGHRAYPRFNTAVRLIEHTRANERLAPLFTTAQEAFAESFRDGSLVPDDQPILAELLIRGWGYDHFFYRNPDAVRTVTRRLGPDWRWLHLVILGESERMQAWKDRGGGYANSVTDRSWQLFAAHMVRAGTNFSTAWQLRPELPLAPAQRIDVAMSMADAAEMRLWFERATAAQIDYEAAWRFMRWGLRPRWHGNVDTMLEFGVYAVNTGRFDTDVPRKLFDSINDVESEMPLPFGYHIYHQPNVWPHLERMYEGYIAAPSEEHARPGWRSTYAVVAYLAGRYELARKQLESIDWKPWERNLTGWSVDLSLLPFAVAALTSPLRDQVYAAENSVRQGKIPDALSQYRELESNPAADPRTARYIQYRLAALKLEKQFQDGQWVSLMPKGPDDPAWRILAGKVRSEDQAVVVESEKDGGHLIVSRFHVGVNFEIQGAVEVLQNRSTNGSFHCGLVIGFPEYATSDWYAVRLRGNQRRQGQVSFSKAWSRQEFNQGAPIDPATNSIHLKFADGKLDVEINGEPVLQGQAPNPQMRINADNFLVGLGIGYDDTGTVLRYRDLNIRRVAK